MRVHAFLSMSTAMALLVAQSSQPLMAETIAQENTAARALGPSRRPLGGGLLEAILTGNNPAPSWGGGAVYNDPQRAMVNQQPMSGGQQRTASVQPQQAVSQTSLQRAVDPIYYRQEVAYTGTEKAGTIVVDTPNKFLYLVQGGGRALRYGIGVGRPGFEWSGVKTITRKAEWPDWTPPEEMLKRRPELPAHMDGGPDNPLGARAMYLGSSLYRIHGTNEPNTIGTNVSSGCIRLMNEDVTDLYERVKVGTKVIVM